MLLVLLNIYYEGLVVFHKLYMDVFLKDGRWLYYVQMAVSKGGCLDLSSAIFSIDSFV